MNPPELSVLAPPLLLALLAIPGVTASDYRGSRPGRYLCKPLAALAFVWLALALDATNSAYGQWLLAGLVACLVGDLLLMPERELTFLAGLGAFAIGHLLYAAAFLQATLNPPAAALGSPLVVVLLLASWRWLRKHLDRRMRIPVALYIVVICGMLMCSLLTIGTALASLAVSGALGFALSDLAVARQQFVKPTRLNALWGTPLYFLSQLLIAGSVTLA